MSSVLAGGAAVQKRVFAGKFLAEAPAGLIQGDPMTPSLVKKEQGRFARRCLRDWQGGRYSGSRPHE
jgi:hypothetical protein